MKTLRFRLCAMPVAMLSLWFQMHVSAAPLNLFSVNVTPEKEMYAVGEPVALILSVTYLGATPIDVPHPWDHQGYSEDIEMALPETREFRRLFTDEEAEDARANRPRMPLIHMEPNSKQIRTNWYQCWPQMRLLPLGLVFPDAGEYLIRAGVSWQGRTNYATTRVILKSRSLDEQRAYEWLERSGTLCTLKDLWDAGRDPKEYGAQAVRFRELRQQFPSTAFTQFLDRTFMRASNIICRPDTRFLHLLGDKPRPIPSPKAAP